MFIEMDDVMNENEDRRRSPRFSCGGRAVINRLPSDGALVSGRLRNLSLGGICVDTPHPIDHGARTEVVVCVDAVSFRAVGLVKAMQERSRACMEFVQMSAGSKGMLADLVEQLAKLQTVMAKLRSARVGTDAELLRKLQEAGVRPALFGERFFSLRRAPAGESPEQDIASATDREPIVELAPLVIRVDLFG